MARTTVPSSSPATPNTTDEDQGAARGRVPETTQPSHVIGLWSDEGVVVCPARHLTSPINRSHADPCPHRPAPRRGQELASVDSDVAAAETALERTRLIPQATNAAINST